MEIKIEKMPLKNGLVIKSQCKIFSLAKTMKRSFPRLINYVKQNSIEFEQSMYAMYENVKWEEMVNQGKLKMFWDSFFRIWYFHCGVAVKNRENGKGDIEPYEYPNTRVVSCIHKGPYYTVSSSYNAMYKWLTDQGYKADNKSFEIYLNDPRGIDKSEILTKILIPIKE